MAKAPKPGGAGTTGGDEKVDALQATTIMRLKTPNGLVERSIRLGAVNFRERAAVRKATGMAFESFLGDADGAQIGLDTIQVWWWLAMRGENPMASLDQALAEWPDVVDADSFEVIQDDGEDDSPEA